IGCCYAQLSQTTLSTIKTGISTLTDFSSTLVHSTQSIESTTPPQPSVTATPTTLSPPAPGEVTPPVICASSPVSNPTLLPNGTIPAVAVTTGYSQSDLNRLWDIVEANLPVSRPVITTVVEPLPTFTTGPEPPPFRPTFIRYSTQNLTLPKGFKYGVAGAAQQVEGAVKDG